MLLDLFFLLASRPPWAYGQRVCMHDESLQATGLFDASLQSSDMHDATVEEC